jgi:hypothetical protein
MATAFEFSFAVLERAANREDSAGGKPVGQSAERKNQRTENEAQLNCAGKNSDIGNARTLGSAQIVGRTIRAEPERGAQQLRHCDGHDRIEARLAQPWFCLHHHE